MAELPITRVVLYKHGVGHFERQGSVDGDASIQLHFKQREVSDVLKSLTVLDLDGGHISAVSYDSMKPIEQLLAEIALSIPDSDSLLHLVPQLKGARVSVRRGEPAMELEGSLLGVDVRESRSDNELHRQALVSVLTDTGAMLSFDLFNSGLTLLDAGLRRDLDFYLRTQLSAKKKDSRGFTLFARGDGKRTVRLSYVLEAPVWKATYRILLNEGAKEDPLIQGWAVVDNAQEDDWNDVQLSLVAGLPVSFVHDLYTPRFIRRPVVAVQETSGVLPPMVESGEIFAASEMPMERSSMNKALYGSFSEDAPMSMRRASAPSSVHTHVRERQIGDLFEYEIEKPVSIRRNQSALVPIVLKPFTGRSVLLYQKAARAENPMRCIEFENTTGLTLEGGPLTVLESDRYVGEAMLDTLKPSEKRLVPYAVELGVRVMDSIGTTSEKVSKVIVRAGYLYEQHGTVRTTIYTVIGKSDHEQILFVDHPRDVTDWTLINTVELHETTEHYWRLRHVLPANTTIKIVVTQRRIHETRIVLSGLDNGTLGIWVQQKYFDAKTEKTLRDAIATRDKLGAVIAEINRMHTEKHRIADEQKRIRENLQSLSDRSSEKELRERYVKIFGQQEDQIEAIDKQSKIRNEERKKLETQLEAAIAGIDYEGEVK